MVTKKPAAKKAAKTVKRKPAAKTAKRVGTAKPLRKSQITGKAPSKRLVKRRKTNTTPGYFPNPAEVAAAHAPAKYYVATMKSHNTLAAAKKEGQDIYAKTGIPLRIICD
jgi:hypothetical protein